MVNAEKTFTHDQLMIIKDLVATHEGLDESQISFDGNDVTPIFDYPAISYLRLKLTDIKDLDAWITDRSEHGRVTAKCIVILSDGRSTSVEASAQIGEVLGNGEHIDSVHFAESMAQARAGRLAIRSVGINLYLAHKSFVKSGDVTNGNASLDPRLPQYREIHMLAENLGFINGSDKTEYRMFLAETFSGKVTSKDLDDLEIQRLLATLRQLDRIRRSRIVNHKLAA